MIDRLEVLFRHVYSKLKSHVYADTEYLTVPLNFQNVENYGYSGIIKYNKMIYND